MRLWDPGVDQKRDPLMLFEPAGSVEVFNGALIIEELLFSRNRLNYWKNPLEGRNKAALNGYTWCRR